MELAKWEDRGYHALRQSTEKAQRQLHKMQRAAAAVLQQAAAAPLADAAKAMGFGDLKDAEAVVGAGDVAKGGKRQRRKNGQQEKPDEDATAQVRMSAGAMVLMERFDNLGIA